MALCSGVIRYNWKGDRRHVRGEYKSDDKFAFRFPADVKCPEGRFGN